MKKNLKVDIHMKKHPKTGIELYDMDASDFPTDYVGELRTVQVFECPICGALTNKRVIGFCNQVYGRTSCPYSTECWHHVLENMIEVANQPQPKSFKQEMLKDIAAFRAKYANQVQNDLVGEPNLEERDRDDIETRGYLPGTFCVHDLGPHALSIDETFIERSAKQVSRIKEAGAYRPLEDLIADEPAHVKVVVRKYFYGNDSYVLLYPTESQVTHNVPHKLFMRGMKLVEQFRASREHDRRKKFYEGEL